MLYAIGKKECIRNAYLLSQPYSDETLNDKYFRLKKSLFTYMNKDSFDNKLSFDDDQFTLQEKKIDYLLSHFTDDPCQLTDISVEGVDTKTPVTAMQQVMERVSIAKQYMKYLDPQVYDIFNIYIHTMFYVRSLDLGGGSVSSAPGVIWCSIRKNWTSHDIVEFLIHELCHNLLFMDEKCHQHYYSITKLEKPDNFATSAILKIERPLDKAFHSLVVGHSILCFRRAHGCPVRTRVHPNTVELRRSCMRTLDSIGSLVAKRQHLVTPRFLAIQQAILKDIVHHD